MEGSISRFLVLVDCSGGSLITDLDDFGPDEFVLFISTECHLEKNKEAVAGVWYFVEFTGKGDTSEGCCGHGGGGGGAGLSLTR